MKIYVQVWWGIGNRLDNKEKGVTIINRGKLDRKIYVNRTCIFLINLKISRKMKAFQQIIKFTY